MKYKSLFAKLISILMCMAVLSGCSLPLPEAASSETENTSPDDENQITSLGLEPDLDYDRPVTQAHIEINQLGYSTQARKIAIFRGEDLSRNFEVIDPASGETVFTGEIKKKSVRGSQEIFYYGLFSELTEPGTYCIKTDVIGYSYPFEIKEDIYDGLLNDALKQYYYNRCGISLAGNFAGDYARNACHTNLVTLKQDATVELDVTGGWHVDMVGDRDVVRGCNTIEALLMAFEYNNDSFGDDSGIPESGDDIPDILNEIRYEVDWLLKMQEQATGAVYKAVSVVDKGNGDNNPCHVEAVDMSSTLSFASALGYFSYIYQTYDAAFATTCLKAADRAMKYAAKFPDMVDANEYFRAATMLYRATGYGNYREIIRQYATGNTDFDMSDNVVFTGAVTYLATKQKTESAICDVMMKNLKSYAETMAGERSDALFLMGEETKAVENSALLSEIARLTVVNYIISSNEYERVMEKYLHYFMGCNPTNVCYVGKYGKINITDTDLSRDILRQPEQDAYLILLISGITLR